MKPKRIQRKRTKGWRMPANTISVTRPGAFGNPFAQWDNETAVAAFRRWLETGGAREWSSPIMVECRETLLRRLPELRGKNLACWCGGEPCHADVLLEMANK